MLIFFLSLVDDYDMNAIPTVVRPPTDAKTLERLSERSYVKDWQRLGLCNQSPTNGNSRQRHDQFRITTVNSAYMLCRRYLSVFF